MNQNLTRISCLVLLSCRTKPNLLYSDKNNKMYLVWHGYDTAIAWRMKCNLNFCSEYVNPDWNEKFCSQGLIVLKIPQEKFQISKQSNEKKKQFSFLLILNKITGVEK